MPCAYVMSAKMKYPHMISLTWIDISFGAEEVAADATEYDNEDDKDDEHHYNPPREDCLVHNRALGCNKTRTMAAIKDGLTPPKYILIKRKKSEQKSQTVFFCF